MTLSKETLIYGGLTGAIIGMAYVTGRAWWGGDVSTVTAAELIPMAAVGAVGGILAFAFRRSTGEDV